MIEQHLLALLVILPLLAAPVALLLPGRRAPWWLATLIGWLVFALAIGLVVRVAGGPVEYWMGGWEPPWGIAYRADALNAFIALVVTGVSAVVLMFARRSVEAEVREAQLSGFYTAYLLALAGLLGITLTGDVFNLFVFLEISSLASYILISLSRDRRGLMAAFQYLVFGTLGATFLLIGIGLLYAMTGTLNMLDLAARLEAVEQTRTVYTGFAFIVVGVGIKLAIFPLHLWLPNAYAYGPSVVSAFLAATATKVALYVLLRFMFTIFGAGFAFGATLVPSILIALAVAAILSGSFWALMQTDVKRLLAYSSVAQIGYMVLGVGMFSVVGLTAAAVHVFNHALMKGALFLAMGCVAYRLGGTELRHLRGTGKSMPLTMAAFVVAGLSLVGVPLTAGFISKWYLVQAAIEAGWWPAVIVVLAGSLLALAYIWKVVEVAYFQEPDPGSEPVAEVPPGMLVPLLALALANIYFGIDTRLPLGLADSAARLLMGGAP